MIIIKVSPTGIEDVDFDCGGNDEVEDFMMRLMWPIIRPYLYQMNDKLQWAFGMFMEGMEKAKNKGNQGAAN